MFLQQKKRLKNALQLLVILIQTRFSFVDQNDVSFNNYRRPPREQRDYEVENRSFGAQM